jgi:hypothetical protein
MLAVRTPRLDIGAPFLVCFISLADAFCARPAPNTGFCSLATNFDHESPSSLPHGTSGSSARSICAARGRLSLRTHVPILVIRSILPLLAFVFCSHSSLAGALRARTGGLGLGLGAVKVSRTCS